MKMIRKSIFPMLTTLLRHNSASSSCPSSQCWQPPAYLSKKILKETRVSREHLTPEIALQLITPECRLFHAAIADICPDELFSNEPFWGFYWPGGQAISRYLLDNRSIIWGKSVLDVGSGCGASSLASIMSGAKYVVANDIDLAAGCALYLNADLNKVPRNNLQFCDSNLINCPVNEDIILLGDLFYDEEFAALLLPWLQELRANGKYVLIGDPGRHGLTEKRLSVLNKLATYALTDNCCIENNGFRFVHVWQFK